MHCGIDNFGVQKASYIRSGRQDRSDAGQLACERAREWVSLRLDGELSELEEAMLRRPFARLRRVPRVRGSRGGVHVGCAVRRSRLRPALAPVFEAAPRRGAARGSGGRRGRGCPRGLGCAWRPRAGLSSRPSAPHRASRGPGPRTSLRRAACRTAAADAPHPGALGRSRRCLSSCDVTSVVPAESSGATDAALADLLLRLTPRP